METTFIEKKRIPHNKISDEQISRIIELYKIHWNIDKVKEILGLARNTIRLYILKEDKDLFKYGKKQINKIKIESNLFHRKYSIDYDYFSTIDTQEKAYILGFLYADGYNSEERGCVKVSIQKQDIKILEFIKEQTKSNFLIKEVKGYSVLEINCKKISNDLSLWGCTQAKTFTLQFPTFLSDELLRHFVRGYLDGDGSIQTARGYKTTTISFIGNIEFLKGLNNYFNRVINTEIRNVRYYSKCDNKIGELRYSKKCHILLMKELLYCNSSFFLERKFNKLNTYL